MSLISSTSFALDACSRRYLNCQHSIVQLVAGSLVGIVNCSVVAAVVHRNYVLVAEFDGFLKSSQGIGIGILCGGNAG